MGAVFVAMVLGHVGFEFESTKCKSGWHFVLTPSYDVWYLIIGCTLAPLVSI